MDNEANNTQEVTFPSADHRAQLVAQVKTEKLRTISQKLRDLRKQKQVIEDEISILKDAYSQRDQEVQQIVAKLKVATAEELDAMLLRANSDHAT